MPSLHEIGCTFLGRNCSQSWMDFLFWEQLLNEHPELSSIVELGTGEGGFSHYLSLQAEARGMRFATFDHVRMEGQKVRGFRKLDIFTRPEKVLEALIPPTVLFCDDGDKPREVEFFAPFLQPKNLLVVHDWFTEIYPVDIPTILRPVHEDLWTASTAVFART